MSLFSTPQQQPQQSSFQFPNQQQEQQQQQQPQQSSFQFPNQQQQQQQQQQNSFFSQQPQQNQQPQQQQQLFLFTNDKAPATYSTKWADLHPDSHKILFQIEEKILQYRDESQRLDQCSRLFDSSISSDSFEIDAAHVMQELGGINTSMERQKAVLHELMMMVKDMLRNTELAIRSFMMLSSRFQHPKSDSGAASQVRGATTGASTTSQPAAHSSGLAVDFYSGLPKKPSLFMQQTVARFEKYLGECRQWIEELEQLVHLDSEHNFSNSNSLLQSLPKVITNVHDFFIHVAAKVESIHQYIESMRAAYLADQRRRGEGNDPFLEADRRESARQEAAARRVHPTLHMAALPQSSTQAAGLFSSSVAPSNPSIAPQTAALSSSSGSGFSMFPTSSTAPTTPASTSALFTTPAPAPAPVSSIFGPPSASPQTPFPNLATSTSTPLFGPSAPGGNSLFSTPIASGAVTGSGTSFGTVGRSTRPKARTSRR